MLRFSASASPWPRPVGRSNSRRPRAWIDWPLAGRSCCSGGDCRRSEYCVLPNGHQGIVSRFGCVAIPWPRVLGVASPDGAPHLCEAPLTTIFVPYCVVLGGDS